MLCGQNCSSGEKDQHGEPFVGHCVYEKNMSYGNHNRMVIQMALKSTKIQESAVRLRIHQNYLAKFPRDSAGYLDAAMPLSMASLAGE